MKRKLAFAVAVMALAASIIAGPSLAHPVSADIGPCCASSAQTGP